MTLHRIVAEGFDADWCHVPWPWSAALSNIRLCRGPRGRSQVPEVADVETRFTLCTSALGSW